MPVYESIKNADNKIVISAQNKDSVVFGWDKVVTALADKVAAGAKVVAIDGWYGINYEKIAKAVAAKVGGEVVMLPADELFVTREEIVAYNQPYVTDDPGFGKVNKTGVIVDIMNADAIAAAIEKMASGAVVIIYGMGASIKAFESLVDVKCYVDNTLQYHSLKASILQHSVFFMAQLSHTYMTTGKTIALTIGTFVSQLMSVLFNMLPRFVIVFFQRATIF